MEDTRPKGPFARTIAKPNRVLRPSQSPMDSSLPTSQHSSPPKSQQVTPVKLTEEPRQTSQQYTKGVNFLRLLLRAKYITNLTTSFNRIKAYSIRLKDKTIVFASKLKKLMRAKRLELQLVGLRKLAVHAARHRVGFLRNKSVISDQAKKVSFSAFLHLLNGKFVGAVLHAFHSLLAHKRFFDRIQAIKRNSKLRFLAVLLKVRMAEAWSKVHEFSLYKLRDPLKALRSITKLLANKLERSSNLGFQFIKRVSVLRKTQQNMKPENRGVSQKQQKLMDELEQLTQETSTFKRGFEEEMSSKEQQKQELSTKLEQLNQTNTALEQSIQQLQEVKRQASPSLTAKDVYERVYHNFLYFLKYANDEIPKSELLESLLTPMCRLEMPTDIIQQENEALQEVIDQYKRLNLKIPPQPISELPYIAKPYEHLLRENSELYCALAAMIDNSKARHNDRDFVQLIEDFTKLEQQFVKVRVGLNDK